MAKNNIFLGTAAGSVGDVTVYRRSGAQVARVRVRDVANPRTTSQSTQRNFLAPVAKFYAPLAVVLEKSFEGLNKSASYSAFLKKNIEKARENGWYLDKGTPFFPLPYQVSRGTLQPVKYLYDEENSVLLMSTDSSEAGSTIGALSKHFISKGYQEGDQVTIICVAVDSDNNYFPISGRFIIEPNSTALLVSALPQFMVRVSNSEVTFDGANSDIVAGAIIVSRFENNIWRRSTQALSVSETIMSTVTSEAARKAAIASYGDNSYANDGNVYLDGAGTAFNIAAQDGTALLFYGGQYNVNIVESGETQYVQLIPANKSVPYFIKLGTTGTSYISGDNTPSAWEKATTAPEDANAANTIVVESIDSDMAKYLQSIGTPLTILS